MAKKEMKMKVKAESPVSDEKWKAEGDFRTLKEAEIIKEDKERLKKALSVGKEEKCAINSVMQLRELANKAHMEESEEEDGE